MFIEYKYAAQHTFVCDARVFYLAFRKIQIIQKLEYIIFSRCMFIQIYESMQMLPLRLCVLYIDVLILIDKMCARHEIGILTFCLRSDSISPYFIKLFKHSERHKCSFNVYLLHYDACCQTSKWLFKYLALHQINIQIDALFKHKANTRLGNENPIDFSPISNAFLNVNNT